MCFVDIEHVCSYSRRDMAMGPDYGQGFRHGYIQRSVISLFDIYLTGEFRFQS